MNQLAEGEKKRLIAASGGTGTIGRHLPQSIIRVRVDLEAGSHNFNHGGPDEIDFIHLAGIVGVSKVNEDLNRAFRINVLGTRMLAEEFLSKSNGKFYFVSSSHVYKPSTNLLSEDAEINPTSAYAELKLEAEEVLKEVFKNNKSRLGIVRVFSVLSWNVPDFTLGGGIRKLADPDSNFVLKNADDVRDFLAPKQIAQALFEIAHSGNLTGVTNLCTGFGTSVREAAHKMLCARNLYLDSSRIHPGNSSNPFVVGDNGRLRAALPHLNLSWDPT